MIVRVRNGRAKAGVGSYLGFGIGRPKSGVGSQGSALVSGQIGICLLWLCGSPTVVVWSKGMCVGRAKTAVGSGEGPPETDSGFIAVGRLQ